MSHVVQIKTEVRDKAAVHAACARLKLTPPREQTVKLFSSAVTGLAVQLPAWRYPVVCQLATGELAYDNFEGRWGEQCQLDRFLQAYAVEMAKLQARKQGLAVAEHLLSDGSIKLVIAVGGAT
ncbi:MAG TPA: hypothetical protein VL096_12995 [Pirellulaceae bacterium]|nr:hypothetical protein [Pirellulaceae bacterium]